MVRTSFGFSRLLLAVAIGLFVTSGAAAAETTFTLSLGEVSVEGSHDTSAPWRERRGVYRDALAEALESVQAVRPKLRMKDELSIAFVAERCWPLVVAMNEIGRGQSAWLAYSDPDRRLRLLLEVESGTPDLVSLRERSLALADPPIPTDEGRLEAEHAILARWSQASPEDRAEFVDILRKRSPMTPEELHGALDSDHLVRAGDMIRNIAEGQWLGRTVLGPTIPELADLARYNDERALAAEAGGPGYLGVSMGGPEISPPLRIMTLPLAAKRLYEMCEQVSLLYSLELSDETLRQEMLAAILDDKLLRALTDKLGPELVDRIVAAAAAFPIEQFAIFHNAPPGTSPLHEGTVWGRIAHGE